MTLDLKPQVINLLRPCSRIIRVQLRAVVRFPVDNNTASRTRAFPPAVFSGEGGEWVEEGIFGRNTIASQSHSSP